MAPNPVELNRLVKLGLAGVLLGYLVLALAFNVAIPPYESFDEASHVGYVEYVAANGWPPVMGSAFTNAETGQPPAYYYIAAPLLRFPSLSYPIGPMGYALPSDPPGAKLHHDQTDLCVLCHAERRLHLMRFLSTVFGVGTLLLSFLIARFLFPAWRAMWFAIPGIVGFQPQFLYLNSVVNNDSLAFACAAVTLLGALGISQAADTRKQLRFALLCGVGTGAAFLTKEYAFTLLPLPLIALAVSRTTIKSRIYAGLIVAGSALAIAGVWLVRNQALYGQPWPFRAELANVVRTLPFTVWTGRPPLSYFTDTFPREFYESFWYSGGWGQIRLPGLVYGLLGVLGLLLLLGLTRLYWARHVGRIPPSALLVLAAAIASCLLGALYTNITIHQPQGRYLLPALPAIAVLMALGAAGLAPTRWSSWMPATLPPLLAILTSLILLLVARPAYYG